MAAHPDFAGRPPPRHAAFGQFVLEVLTPKDVEEDFEAVSGSEHVLSGLFDSDWPRGLTLRKNREDLIRHQAEFDAEEAFAWIIRDRDGAYLGCAYLDPEPDMRGQAQVFTWIRDRDDRAGLLDAFNTGFADWLASHLPEDYRLSWTSNDAASYP